MRLMTLVLSCFLGASFAAAAGAEGARDSFQKFLKAKAAAGRNDAEKALEYHRLARYAKLCDYDEDSVATCLRSLRNDPSFDGKKLCVAAESRKSACEKEAGEIETQLEKYRKQMKLRNRDGKLQIGRRAIKDANKAAAPSSSGDSAGDGQN